MVTLQSTTVSPSVEYRPIPGWPGYRVGDDGSVWTAWEKTAGGRGSGQGKGRYIVGQVWRRRRAKMRPGHYPMVSFKIAGKWRALPIHRLVLLAFVGPKPLGFVCRHIDGNKHNNTLSNLRWGTQQENVNDMHRHGTVSRGETHPGAKLSPESVRRIRDEVARGTTLDVLASQYGVNRNAIWLVAKRRSWKHVEDVA